MSDVPDYLDETVTTEDNIRQRMLDRVPATVDKSEGSYVWDSISPVAIELVFVAMMAQKVLELGFAQTTNGEYLDMRAEEHGVFRRAAVIATGKIQITGTPNSVIPEGVKVSTEADATTGISSVEFVTTETVTLDANGNGQAAIEACIAGTSGNLPAGSIVVLVDSRRNVKSVINAQPTAGGVDIEDDDTLRTRYLKKVRTPGTSGNIADYEQWAMEISGVGAVHVIPLWNGPGSVKVVILGSDKKAPTPDLIAAVQAYISPNNDGERKAPIGATVTVVGAEMVAINIEATLLLDNTKTISLAEIKEKFTAAITSYLASTAFQADTVRYARVGSLLVEQEGVIDYVDYTLNGGATNISVAQDQVAVTGTVILHVQ